MHLKPIPRKVRGMEAPLLTPSFFFLLLQEWPISPWANISVLSLQKNPWAGATVGSQGVFHVTSSVPTKMWEWLVGQPILVRTDWLLPAVSPIISVSWENWGLLWFMQRVEDGCSTSWAHWFWLWSLLLSGRRKYVGCIWWWWVIQRGGNTWFVYDIRLVV